MVVGAFPVAKLGALLLKQVSKPIANAVKQQAKNSPVFRTYVCMPPAQFYNWCEVKLKMWILNLGKPVNIPVLSEAMAIELGANLLGEGIIFVIAAAILVAEYNRSATKEAAKEAAKQAEMEQIHNALRDVFFQAEQHSAQIREIMRMVGDLESRVVQKPWVPKKETSPILEEVIVTPKALPEERHRAELTSFGDVPDDSSDSLILRSLSSLEQEFLNRDLKVREPGILMEALDYIKDNVYSAT